MITSKSNPPKMCIPCHGKGFTYQSVRVLTTSTGFKNKINKITCTKCKGTGLIKQ